ncbi:MAG: hypothetical protein D3910_25480, partial [Candidatus Electrothrix sp. ATG2]|nr:hypothetical protein [Candidatus Electrothrix sp. ATG2]
MNELLQLFITECRELLESASKHLLKLEKRPTDTESLTIVFRSFHTLKSSADMFEYDAITRLMHSAEDQLDSLRSGKLTLNTEMTDQFLDCLDIVGQWIDYIEMHQSMPDEAEEITDSLIAKLQALMPTGKDIPAPPPQLPSTPPPLSAGQKAEGEAEVQQRQVNEMLVEWLRPMGETRRR